MKKLRRIVGLNKWYCFCIVATIPLISLIFSLVLDILGIDGGIAAAVHFWCTLASGSILSKIIIADIQRGDLHGFKVHTPE